MDMYGVRGRDTESQAAFCRECCGPELRERLRSFDIDSFATAENGEIGYGPTDAEFLYCFIAAKRPERVVQVGAGFSTAVILRAAEDANCPLEVVCVDPYPTGYLRRMHISGKIRLISEMAETVALETLTNVGRGGMLFVDSTHAVKAGSEVNRIILDVLPRLSSGAYVHFHDIYFPYDYQRTLLTNELFFSSESTLLHAFLIGQPRYTIRCSLSMLHYAQPTTLSELLPNYRPRLNDDGLDPPHAEGDFPSATYLQVIA